MQFFYSKCQVPLVLFEVVSCHCFTLKVPGATVLFERFKVPLFYLKGARCNCFVFERFKVPLFYLKDARSH